MSNHYKKLLLILIPACAGFCLALALGSAEEPCELCHLCQNKALVKEAILALYEYPDDPNLPERFDPNYKQFGPDDAYFVQIYPTVPSVLSSPGSAYEPFTFESIIAEGDMVTVRVEWGVGWDSGLYDMYFQLATYRIANGKIVEAWVSPKVLYGYDR